MAFFRLTAFSLFIFLMACEGDDNTPTSRAELLAGTDTSGKTWSITEIELEKGDLNVKDCISDNIIRYFPDGRYAVTEGFELCNDSDPVALQGTWSLNSDETRLSIILGDSAINWDIESLNSRTQIISAELDGDFEIYTLSSSN